MLQVLRQRFFSVVYNCNFPLRQTFYNPVLSLPLRLGNNAVTSYILPDLHYEVRRGAQQIAD